jgi:L,D-transpeptidase ErfK/SrfK
MPAGFVFRLRWLTALVVVIVAGAAPRAGVEPAVVRPLVVGARFLYTVQPGDSLWVVGARFGVELSFLSSLNALSVDARLRPGQVLVVDNRHLVPSGSAAAIVINVPQRMLFYTAPDGAMRAYPVGLGRPTWPTFVGTFSVASLETNPVWDVPRSIQEEMRRAGKPVLTRVAPGPDNPLGALWIGLDRPGYGIHGTNAPASIYHFQTHGCIRLHPDDIAGLFALVNVGTPGEIVYEPLLLSRDAEGRIWLEAHQDIYRRVRDPLAAVRELASHEELEGEMDWAAVRAVLRARQGTPIDVSAQTSRNRS